MTGAPCQADAPGAVGRLRKTGADHLRRSGVSLRVAQEMGSWVSPQVMLEHYTAPQEEEMRDAAQSLDSLVSGKAQDASHKGRRKPAPLKGS